jgi:putative Mg2+ transporter-C (MgtC) family protein
MPITPTWLDIAVRLLWTVVTGALFGLNRSEHGRAAGLRTSILVCLAASVAMIQVNLLLPLAGRSPNSFVMNDLMRLPLGILSGMGFIGAGAIVRRGNLVTGVTTAATMWFLTVVGLCFGGGQIGLGLTGAAIGLFVLVAMKFAEDRMTQDHHGRLVIVMSSGGPDDHELREIIRSDGFEIESCSLSLMQAAGEREMRCHLRWRARSDEVKVPASIYSLGQRAGVSRISWTPQVR